MKIAFYKAKYGDWISKIIAWRTGGPYCHCELVHKKRSFRISFRNEEQGFIFFKNKGEWDEFEIEVNQEKVIEYLNHVKPGKYDFWS